MAAIIAPSRNLKVAVSGKLRDRPCMVRENVMTTSSGVWRNCTRPRLDAPTRYPSWTVKCWLTQLRKSTLHDQPHSPQHNHHHSPRRRSHHHHSRIRRLLRRRLRRTRPIAKPNPTSSAYFHPSIRNSEDPTIPVRISHILANRQLETAITQERRRHESARHIPAHDSNLVAKDVRHRAVDDERPVGRVKRGDVEGVAGLGKADRLALGRSDEPVGLQR
jgi:predicted nucleic acid-binding protein